MREAQSISGLSGRDGLGDSKLSPELNVRGFAHFVNSRETGFLLDAADLEGAGLAFGSQREAPEHALLDLHD